MDANQDNRKDFESLHTAALQVDEALKQDDNLSNNATTSSDLKDLLQAPRSGAVKYYIRSPTKISDNTQAMGASENRVQQIEETQSIPIPSDIREELRQRDDIIASFTGILPEINRVWITIDNVLYFWNYLYGDDYQVYEGLQEVVYSVTTVCPRPDAFNDNVAYLLVVVTPVEVTLLAVVKGANIADQNGVFQLRSIQPTKYTVPSDNLTFLAVAGSCTGRIFLAGSDCNLYEFEYKNEESSWSYLLGIGPDFSCKKRKYNCATGMSSFFTFFSSEDDTLQDLVVDDVRRLLYAISKRGRINVFYLPPDSAPKMVITANIIEKAKVKRSVTVRYKYDEVHSIYVIPVEESVKMHGVVALSSGIRLYFSVKVRSHPFTQTSGPDVMPSDIDVEHIRLPVQSEQIEALKRANHSQDEGFPAGLPNADPNSRRHLSKALYSYGSYFTALQDTSSENILINAKMEWTGSTVREDSTYELKENLCALRHSEDDSLFIDKVEDIRESCNHVFDMNTSKLSRLFFASKPDQYNTTGSSTAKRKAPLRTELEPIPGAAPCLPYLSRSVGYGYSNDDLQSVHRQSELSFQMLPTLSHTQRQFLVLTNKALHIVTQRRPVDYLYALLQTPVDERTLCDGINRRMFEYYGLLQCSAMCVAVACDLPCDVSSMLGEDHSFSMKSEVHESLKRNAIAVMKEIGARNTIAPLPLTNTPSSNSVVNPFQSSSQILEYSTTFYALYQVFSRIVRPIWYRVFVQMNQIDGKKVHLPLLDTYELEAVKRPLYKLVDILRNWHRDAIDCQGSTSMNAGLGGFAKPNRGVPTGISNQKYRENQARLAENKALNIFYRILTRTCQAVSMMQILIEADEVHNLNVEWARLHDNDDVWTFKKIVTIGEYHDRIKSILKDLVCVNDATRNTIGRTDTEYITKKLSSECFQYFSIGDVHQYKGSNELHRALAAPYDSHERDQHTITAINEMCKAAVYWRSMGDVTTINSIISPLESTCDLLLNLGEIGQEGIVSVCMSCARGFGGGDKDGQSFAFTSQSSWEESLYHSGSVATVEDRYNAKKACYQALIQRIAQVQEREFMALGAGVTNHAADVIEASDRNVKVMINKAIDGTKDLDFHTMLYNFLISNQLDDYLLTLDTIHVENYLVGKDQMKLYQYYELHKRYYEAMELMTKIATVDEPTPLIFRIDCLSKAVRSADSACRNPDLRYPRNTVDALNDRTDRLHMAEFQLKLAEILDGKAEEASRLREEADRINQQGVLEINDPDMRRLQLLMDKVKSTLMTYDEMFKEVTVPFGLWEESLEIIYNCNHEDEALVKTLWRSIIFSIIPVTSNIIELRRFIEEWRRIHDTIFIDRRREKPGVLLEHTDSYMQELGVKVRDLGKVLNADDGGYVFPLVMLIEDLEKLVITLNRKIGFTLRTFVMDIFRGIGIKHSILMEAYVNTARRQNLSNSNNWDLVQLAWAASDLVVGWTKLANSHGPNEETQAARTSLRMEIRSGRMRQWLKNGLRDSIQRAESLLYNGDAQYISNLKEAKDKIDEAIDATDRFALGT